MRVWRGVEEKSLWGEVEEKLEREERKMRRERKAKEKRVKSHFFSAPPIDELLELRRQLGLDFERFKS